MNRVGSASTGIMMALLFASVILGSWAAQGPREQRQSTLYQQPPGRHSIVAPELTPTPTTTPSLLDVHE